MATCQGAGMGKQIRCMVIHYDAMHGPVNAWLPREFRLGCMHGFSQVPRIAKVIPQGACTLQTRCMSPCRTNMQWKFWVIPMSWHVACLEPFNKHGLGYGHMGYCRDEPANLVHGNPPERHAWTCRCMVPLGVPSREHTRILLNPPMSKVWPYGHMSKCRDGPANLVQCES